MIYLDNAATSFPKSEICINAVKDAMRKCGNSGRSGHHPSVYASEVLFECREEIAGLFGTKPEKVVLTPSCTFALNTAIKCFGGKSAVISDLEHNAVRRPALAHFEKITVFGTYYNGFDDEKTISAFAKALDESGADTAVFTHASNICGRILPVKRMCAEAKKRGVLTVIDGAQSIGYGVLAGECRDADIICAAGHKGLGGPCGTGAMIFGANYEGSGKTIIEGGAGIFSEDDGMPEVLPERYEAGTMSAPLFAGLTASVREKRGFDKTLFRHLTEEIRNIKGVELYGAPVNDFEKYVPVLLFTLGNADDGDAASYLIAHGICIRNGLHCAPSAHRALGSAGGIRVSLGKHNTMRDVKTFLDVLSSYKV